MIGTRGETEVFRITKVQIQYGGVKIGDEWIRVGDNSN